MSAKSRKYESEIEVFQTQFSFADSAERGGSFDSKVDNMDLEVLTSLLALASVKGIGFKTLCSIFNLGLLQKIWQMAPVELTNASQLLGKQKVDLPKIVQSQKDKLLEQGKEQAEKLRADGIGFVSRGSGNYPKRLLALQDPPCWLFIKGNLGVIHSESIVGIVGTRKPSQEGINLAYLCAQKLVDWNIIVLSGFARGIDENAHLGATQNYGQTIAVLGQGIHNLFMAPSQRFWSAVVDNDGAIISEYLPGDPPSRERFLRRNELQAALSRIVIPVECPSLNSGTGATIRRAQKLHRPLVGITPTHPRDPSILETKRNLDSLGIPTFELSEKNSQEFRQHLEQVLSSHNWEPDQRARQDRVFRSILRRFREVQKKISFDETSIDLLAEMLKNELTR